LLDKSSKKLAMKIISSLLLLFFVLETHSQNYSKDTTDLKITVKEILYDPNKFGGAKQLYGKDVDNPEYLYDLFIHVKIDGFDLNNFIDFNNFSLVENDIKIRQRPFFVGFRSYELNKVNLEDFKWEDNFLKYSQEGIENNDHYFIERYRFKKRQSFQQRYYPLRIEPKKNKSKIFYVHFPVKTKNNGDFSLYYKDILIKTFNLVRDKPIKFKN
jgi:hypothetical protein